MIKNVLWILVFIFISCSARDKSEIITREGILTKELRGEKIFDYVSDNEAMNTLKQVTVYNDSLWIMCHTPNPYSENLLIFHHPNHPQKDKGFFKYGKGGMELTDMQISVSDNRVFVNGNNGYTIIPIDSIYNPDYAPKLTRMKISSANLKLLRNDDLIIVNEYFYSYKSVNDKYNPTERSMIRLTKESNYTRHSNSENQVFTHNVGGAVIAVNESKNRIIRAALSVNEIQITDLAFHEIKTIIGPDKNKIDLQITNNMLLNKERQVSYGQIAQTDNFVYLIYMGGNATIDEKSTCEIIKMDWDGIIKQIYHSDISLTYPTIINDKTLYATVFSYDGRHSLMRFEL